MAEIKVYCSVLEGVTFSDRCLFKLSKIIEGNKICEGCILRQLERLKRCGFEEAEARPVKKIKAGRKKRLKTSESISSDTKKSNDMKRSNKIKKSEDVKESEDIKGSENAKSQYSVRDVGKLLGKSERRTQELAKEGKIPARKIGLHWIFNKEEIDRWLSEKGKCIDVVSTTNRERIDVVSTTAIPSRGEGSRPREQSNEDSTQRQKPEIPIEKESF